MRMNEFSTLTEYKMTVILPTVVEDDNHMEMEDENHNWRQLYFASLTYDWGEIKRIMVHHGTGKKAVETDEELIKALQNHFRRIGKSNVQGFHYMDKNADKWVSAKEISDTLKEAGVLISVSRAAELIHGYAVCYTLLHDDPSNGSGSSSYFGGELDVPGYIRLMASAYK